MARAGPHIDGMPWLNLFFFVLTVASTLFVGASTWYYIPLSALESDPLVLLEAVPFVLAILGPLAVHELGHYVMIRCYDVDASLPYFVPFPSLIGTMGAVIRMRGRIPSRKALFDIGVAGPLAGLAATIAVTVVGLSLGPFTVPQSVTSGGQVIVFNNPWLLDIIADLLNRPTSYADPTKTVHPVIMGAWVGMFFTVLNLLPVGQLDGGHIVRAMVGRRQETVAAAVPVALFGISAYLYFVRGLGLNESVGLWAFWGLFSAFIAYRGPANPIDDSSLGPRRIAVGVLTFALGLLCFMLVPIQVTTV